MAYSKGTIRSTYLSKTKVDTYDAHFYNEMLVKLADIYDACVRADGSTCVLAGSAKDDFVAALALMSTDIDGLS